MASPIHEEFFAEHEHEVEPTYFINHFDFLTCEKASLPAALCATSYAPNCWAFDVAAGVADPVAWIGEEQFDQDRDSLARSLMVANRCRPLSPSELKSPNPEGPNAFGGMFIRGVFRKGDLCQALVSEAFNEQGEKELHLCIRGTDLNNHPNKFLSAFQTIVGYFAWTYPRIEKHAEHFVELAQAVAARASDPAHGISRLVISGHSLGGAAAQSLVQRLTDCSVPVRVVTFGSPGTGSGWLKPLDKAIKAIRKGLTFGFSEISVLAEPVEPNAGLPSKALALFSSMACSCAHYFKRPLPLSGPAEQLHFRHPNDPVPKLGSLLYKVGSAPILAMDPREFDNAQEGKSLLANGIGAHSCSRYFRSIQGMLSKNFNDIVPWQDSSFEMKSWASATVQALRVEMSVKPETTALSVAEARLKAIKNLLAINPADPAIDRLRALPAPQTLVDKISKRRKLRKLQAALENQSAFANGLAASSEPKALWNTKPLA